MAWIESFEVHGLAGRGAPVKHTLNRNVNIFWGLNGAGKTTLLKILHAAMNDEVSTIEDLPFERAQVVFRLGNNEAKVTRRYSKANESPEVDDDNEELFLSSNVNIDDVWVNSDGVEHSGWETVDDGDEFQLSLSSRKFGHSYLPITRVTDSGRRMPSYYDDRKRSSDDVFVEQVRDKWRDYAAKSLARIRDIQQQGLATVLAILFSGPITGQDNSSDGNNVDPSEAYSLVRTFLSEQNLSMQIAKSAFIERFERSPEHRQVVAEIQAVRLETEEVLTPQKEFQSVIDSMYRGNKRLLLSAPRSPRNIRMTPISVAIGERAVPLKSLSSGEKQLLQILLEVLSASDNTVIVDEPELSLHVNWQQQLVSSMQRVNADCQLLLASHSPEIMADVPDDFVFEL